MITKKGRDIIKHNFLIKSGLTKGNEYKFTKIKFGKGNRPNDSSISELVQAIESNEFSQPISNNATSLVAISVVEENDDNIIKIKINNFSPKEHSDNISEMGVYCNNGEHDDDVLFARFVFDPIPVSSTSAVTLTYNLYL